MKEGHRVRQHIDRKNQRLELEIIPSEGETL